MTLTRRLLLSYLAIVALTGVVLTVAADRLLRDRVVQEARAELEREAHYLVAAARGRSRPALDSLVQALARATGRRLTIIDSAGAIITDSDFPTSTLGSLENHAARPEFSAALRGRVGTDLRLSTSTGREELKVAVPFASGAARVSSPLPQIDAIVSEAEEALLFGLLVALAAGAFLALGVASGVAAPLTRLTEAARAIARGEHPPLDVRGRGEVGDLARALNTLDTSLTTRMSELERERSETAALISAMVEGVVALAPDGKITAMNPAARRLLGLKESDVPPPAGELFRPRAAREAVSGALRGQTISGLETSLDDRTVLITAHHLEQGGAVLVIHDVTPLKRLEAVRRDFVANVSHELRTPLTVVRGFAETLLNDDPPAPVRHDFLRKTLDHARRMQRLIDDLLDLSRIESGTWEPSPAAIDVAPLVEETWSGLVAAGTRAPRLAVNVAPDARSVTADPAALRQILENVLENARRHTSPAGSVTVSTAREEGAVRIDISDTGAGISTEHLPRVFERFYRGDAARSREMGGTGLGLSIVKHLVEAHGGRVAARSTLGAGTTISISLPV